MKEKNRILPGVDEVYKVHGEVVPVLVGEETWRVALDYLVKLLEDRVPLGIREVSSSDFHQRDA